VKAIKIVTNAIERGLFYCVAEEAHLCPVSVSRIHDADGTDFKLVEIARFSEEKIEPITGK